MNLDYIQYTFFTVNYQQNQSNIMYFQYKGHTNFEVDG